MPQEQVFLAQLSLNVGYAVSDNHGSIWRRHGGDGLESLINHHDANADRLSQSNQPSGFD
jgi:hypothetical protein